jgi:hypothetical protein
MVDLRMTEGSSSLPSLRRLEAMKSVFQHSGLLGEIQAHTQTHIIQSMPIDVELSCQQLLLYTGLRSSVWVNGLLEEVPKKSDDGAKNLNKLTAAPL